jgi:hypothetical protein
MTALNSGLSDTSNKLLILLYPGNTGLPVLMYGIGVLIEKHSVYIKQAIMKIWERRVVFVLENWA